MSEAPFFIGWEGRAAAPLGGFLGRLGAGLLALALGGGLLLALTADDPAGAEFALVPGQAAPAALPEGPLEGALTLLPYPILHLQPDAGHPRGRAVLLAGEGKRGLPPAAGLAEGQPVRVEGYATDRGSIAMLISEAPPLALPGPAAPPAVERLGRWRITGEICDGKCAAGAMRPGTGLAHRACATLCIAGEIPPVFVATGPVAGSAFLLLGGADGGPWPAAGRALIGRRIVLEGAVERRGDLLVFLAALPAGPAAAVAP